MIALLLEIFLLEDDFVYFSNKRIKYLYLNKIIMWTSLLIYKNNDLKQWTMKNASFN
jgi:hypothetical protein